MDLQETLTSILFSPHEILASMTALEIKILVIVAVCWQAGKVDVCSTIDIDIEYILDRRFIFAPLFLKTKSIPAL